MWKDVCNIHIDCSMKQFNEAVQVWITKPHTVNRRLVGTKVIMEVNRVDIRILENEYQIQRLLSLLKDGCQLKECLEDEGVNKSHEDDDVFAKCIIRELIPKQLGRFHSARELVIKDKYGCQFMFLPVVHIDEHDVIMHKDDTMGYKLKYSNTDKLLTVSVTQEVQESPCTSLGISEDWLKLVLLPKLLNWCKISNINTEVSSLKLVPVEKYTLLYQHLKEKHGKKLVDNWPEKTDPRKFVYEDVAIAAYLILLWELERKENGLSEKQTFVDLGCGNGLLVHLLTLEGHKGVGLDIRKRNIWDMYGSDTELLEDSITPDKVFSKTSWLIGNHSDELTPWIPVFATRSSPNCNFFVLPCCPWDFTCKFNAKCSGMSQYRAYLNYIQEVIGVCGFVTEEDTLRIPSTKRVCFIGRKRKYQPEDWHDINKKITKFLKEKCTVNNIKGIVTDTGHFSKFDQQSTNTSNSDSNTLDAFNICTPEFSGTISENVEREQSTSGKEFKPRNYADEKKSHCLTVDSDTKTFIVKTVFEALLAKGSFVKQSVKEVRIWNKGGKITLSEVASLFDDSILHKLKSECGGLQTLLRNHHHIFMVQGGEVQLRDWRESTLHDQHQLAKKKRKGQHLKTDATKLYKTKLCYFNDNHPDGCPLTAENCKFGHGKSDLKTMIL